MSRLVLHPLTTEPILLSPERSERPGAWGPATSEPGTPTAVCPFCPGNEEETPPEISRHASGAAWRARVVPNKYPAIAPIDGTPSHEVLVDSAEHDSPLETRHLDAWIEMFELWRERYMCHARRPGIESVLIFRNEGRAAGQSIAHPHSQLLALPFVSPRLEEERRTFDSSASCPLCSATATSSASESLVVAKSAGIAIVIPQAARLPYETWIVPERHQPDWSDGNTAAIGAAVQRAIRALRVRWPGVPFNLALMSAPMRGERDAFHWHIEILPRLTTVAGFELATGAWMNIVDPGRAAAEIRAALER